MNKHIMVYVCYWIFFSMQPLIMVRAIGTRWLVHPKHACSHLPHCLLSSYFHILIVVKVKTRVLIKWS
jgi:hypothetical protein